MFTPRATTRLHREEKGTAVVEFALVLPVLMLVLYGILEFGLLFYNYIDLTSAARDGGRVAAVSRTAGDPEAAVRSAIAGSTSVVDDGQTTVTFSPAPPWKSGQTVDVKVSYDYSLDVMGAVLWGGPMTADSQVRIE